MIAIDSNIAVALFDQDPPLADELRQAFVDHLDRDSALVFPAPCLGEFWRVVTEPRGLGKAPKAAVDFLGQFLEAVPLLVPGAGYHEVLLGLLKLREPVGAAVFDYQIAAVCIEHGVSEIWTFDQRFPRLDGLEPIDPIR